MNRIWLLACLALLLSGCGLVAVDQNFYLYGTPVKLVNATNLPAVVELGAGRRDLLVAPQSEIVTAVDQGVYIFYTPQTTMNVTARLCRDIRFLPLFAPPAWLYRRDLLGDLAFAPDFFTDTLGEEQLHARANDIDTFLAERKPLGYERMREQLFQWTRAVTAHGFSLRPQCVGSVAVVSYPLYVSNSNYERREETLYIRSQNGYASISAY